MAVLVGPAAREGETNKVCDLGESPRQQREDRSQRRAPTSNMWPGADGNEMSTLGPLHAYADLGTVVSVA